MIDNKYSSAARGREVIEANGFFCAACLVGKSMDDISPDPRYCQGCYEVLSVEAELLSLKARKPDWIPQKGAKTSAYVPHQVTQIMSTVNGKKSEVDIIPPAVQEVTHGKRGPKFTELPDDLIYQWAGEGLGSKAIAAKLKDKRIDISYKTVQRRLQGALI